MTKTRGRIDPKLKVTIALKALREQATARELACRLSRPPEPNSRLEESASGFLGARARRRDRARRRRGRGEIAKLHATFGQLAIESVLCEGLPFKSGSSSLRCCGRGPPSGRVDLFRQALALGPGRWSVAQPCTWRINLYPAVRALAGGRLAASFTRRLSMPDSDDTLLRAVRRARNPSFAHATMALATCPPGE